MAETMNVPVEYIDVKNFTGMLFINVEDIVIFINNNLSDYDQLEAVTHEMGHLKKGFPAKLSPECVHRTYEERAKNWAATYLVSYDEYRDVMRDKFVYNDFEAAEELGVDMATLQRSRRRYELQGLPVSQAELGFVYREP